MIEQAWQLMDDADAIVHYNGTAFDIKHLQREFLLCDLDLIKTPHFDIDLLQTVKRRFKFASNKLQFVSEQLGLAGKVQHDGFDLWKRCMADDEKAWNLMRRYNKQDVLLTEQVYENYCRGYHDIQTEPSSITNTVHVHDASALHTQARGFPDTHKQLRTGNTNATDAPISKTELCFPEQLHLNHEQSNATHRQDNRLVA